MKYCKNCVLPDTRPNITIDNSGVCNACRQHSTKSDIDYTFREKQFAQLAEIAKNKSKTYDCVIPVSGGKDSTWQLVKCLEYGLTPLAVTWKTPARTVEGEQNLKNLISIGVDHIDFQINPEVERKFMLASLIKFGTTAIPMHLALYNIPLTVALRFEIPLLVQGENSSFEYGGDQKTNKSFRLTNEWIRKYGPVHGTSAADWVSEELSEKMLSAYFGPTDKDLEENDVSAIFLGHFFNWDPEITKKVAMDHGFLPRKEGPKTGYYNFADIDDDFISIHHYLKWYKFGMTRLFDNLSLEIRNGRLTRKDAIGIIQKLGDQKPVADIDKLTDFLKIPVQKFYEIIEPFRNLDIWKKRDGIWYIDGFIVPDWHWS